MKRLLPILRALLIVGLTAWLCLVVAGALSGCIRIPVTIYPEFDDKGLPKAIPVAPVGGQDMETGAFLPPFPVSDQSPSPAKDWWPMVEQGLTLVLGLLVGGGGGAVLLRRAKTALAIACRYGDEQEEVAKQVALDLGDEAGSDALQKVAANKRAALALQVDAGVHKVTQRARGKA